MNNLTSEKIRAILDGAKPKQHTWSDTNEYCGWVGIHNLSDLREILALRERVERLEQGGWISVDERLPENEEGCWSEPVIALCDCDIVYRLSCMNGAWQRTQSFADNLSKRVTHWQPLPQPPKENTNERD
jgi:hypothetical protein